MGPEQWLFLQWHEHKGSLVSTFEKLFERNIFVDCTLAAEGQYLNVHKMILSACSPYFEILLNENRDKHPIIILKDVKFRSLKSIIEYMYRGEANVLSTEIKDFLAAAETLQIKGLGKQGGGDTRGQPTKDLRDIVEESLPSCPPEMPIGVGEKENWRGTDHLSSVLSEAAHENAAPKNILFSQGDIVRSIGPQKVPVPILCSQEVETEKPWLKTESTIETSQCLKSVLPTLNLGTHTIEPVHPGSVDQVSDKNACSTSTQNVPKMSDVQMDMEMTPKHEPEPVAQSTPIPPDIEEAETASIVSSVIELSDTTEEWAEEDMEEGPTGSQATANSFAGGTDESRAHFDGASDATRDSVSRDLGSDQQGTILAFRTNLSSSSYTLRTPLQVVIHTRSDSLERSPPLTIEEITSSSDTDVLTTEETQPSDRTEHRTPPLVGRTPCTSRPPVTPRYSTTATSTTSKASSRQSQRRASGVAVSAASAAASARGVAPHSLRSPATTVRRRSAGARKGQNKHVCPKCHKTFSRRSKLKRHMLKHKGSPKSEKSKDEKVLLHQLQAVLKRLETHMTGSNADHTKELVTIKPVSSGAADTRTGTSKKNSSKECCRRHLGSQRNCHVCPLCDEAFPLYGLLNLHMQKHRQNENYKSRKSGYVQSHEKAVSSNLIKQMLQGPYVCRDCDEEFQTRNSLVKHINTVHRGPKQKEKKVKTKTKRRTEPEISPLAPPPAPPRNSRRPKMTKTLYKCNQCTYASRSPHSFAKHLTTHSHTPACSDLKTPENSSKGSGSSEDVVSEGEKCSEVSAGSYVS